MADPSTDVLRGTLDLLILQVAATGPEHGWGLAQRIESLSRDAFKIGQGSLYPALQRLEQKGWIASDWKVTEQNRRARYYRLTASGRRALAAETASWHHYVAAVDLVLNPAGARP